MKKAIFVEICNTFLNLIQDIDKTNDKAWAEDLKMN